MNVILLDGSSESDPIGEQIHKELAGEMQSRGWQVEHILVRQQKIGNCAGDFFCWVRSPGICNVNDDNRKIAEKMAQCDLLVYLTPITFGGYSANLKRMVDHQIQNVLPFFTQVNGEIHHQKRYKKYPDFLAVGWLETVDEQAEAIFRHLAWRNGLNFHARTSVAGVILSTQKSEEFQKSIKGWLDQIKAGISSLPENLPNPPKISSQAEIERALLLVGSPRTRKSSSASLGGYLLSQLDSSGVQTETIYIHTSLRSPQRWQALLEAADAADLIVLAFPLFVDSLPAPVIEALERLAAHRAGNTNLGLQQFAAIANCGFPEAAHNDTALAICAQFASQAGFNWMGGLALGGGEGLVHGLPLEELDGRSIPLKTALERAASALVAGNPIPQEAIALMAKPIIPSWLYRAFGGFGWKQQAKRYGVQKQLKRKPYKRTENQTSIQT
jgi:multimeric flavodoxin WrbA